MGSSERRACADAGARASERSCARVDRARLQASRCTQGRARFAAERRSEIGRRIGEAGAEANSKRKMILVIPSEVENGAAREAATWTGRPEPERTGGERIKSSGKT